LRATTSPLVGISPLSLEHLLSEMEFVLSLVEVLLPSMWVFLPHFCVAFIFVVENYL
jgi:hypothetical protein